MSEENRRKQTFNWFLLIDWSAMPVFLPLPNIISFSKDKLITLRGLPSLSLELIGTIFPLMFALCRYNRQTPRDKNEY